MLHGRGIDKAGRMMSLERTRVIQLMKIESLQTSFDNVHKEVNEKVTSNRNKQIAHHNRKTNIITPDFSVGDFVLIRRAQDKGHKQSFRWIGPRQIVSVVGDVAYDVKNLVDGKVERVHAARLMMYRAGMDCVSVCRKCLEQVEHLESKYEIIEQLMDIGEAADGIFVQMQWSGLPDKCHWTWNEIKQLHIDVPGKHEAFLNVTTRKTLAEIAQSLLGLKS